MNLNDLVAGDIIRYDVTYQGRLAKGYFYLVTNVNDLYVSCISLIDYANFTFTKDGISDERDWVHRIVSIQDDC